MTDLSLLRQPPSAWAGDTQREIRFHHLCLEAAKELEALRADAKRLDFIHSNARCDPKMDGQHVWWPTIFNHRLQGPTLRAAVDNAMKATDANR